MDEGTDPVTHGICPKCAADMLGERSLPLRLFLETLPYPVMIVDREGAVVAANQFVQRVVGKGDRDIVDCLCGVAWECRNATLPEGCGKTEHCAGCTMRRAVTRTFDTGEAILRAPAIINHADGRERRLVISTELKAGVVFLRIDEIT